ncbi:hypothetical protein GQ53DRAFT_293310 [Thozetella sp. PMI_491]|nr:hypothetical protein GQ53DRAFT_293310 [Thozetella sp. PMI_491]
MLHTAWFVRVWGSLCAGAKLFRGGGSSGGLSCAASLQCDLLVAPLRAPWVVQTVCLWLVWYLENTYTRAPAPCRQPEWGHIMWYRQAPCSWLWGHYVGSASVCGKGTLVNT